TIASVVLENGGEPILFGRVSDRLEALRAAVRKAIVHDLLVVSGGSSVGEKDLLIDVVGSMGDVLFHGIAVKPGKPTILGRVDGKAVLGMPGNPTSCLSNGYVILAPMLRRMARLPTRQEKVVEVPLAERVVSTIGRVKFHTVRIVDGEAVPAFKESSAITSMARAVVEPVGLASLTAGLLGEDVILVAKALTELLSPIKMNYEIHGNTIPHLHVHVYPRFVDDPFVGGPIDARVTSFARTRDERLQ